MGFTGARGECRCHRPNAPPQSIACSRRCRAATCAACWPGAKPSSSRLPTCSTRPASASATSISRPQSFISLIMPVDDLCVARSRPGRKRRHVRDSARARRRRVAGARRGAGRGIRVADGRRALPPRTRTQPGAATRDRPLCLRPVDPARADGGLHALPRGRGAARPLAADDPGPRARGQPSTSRRNSWP